MPTLDRSLHLVFDRSLQAALRARKDLMARHGTAAGLGASLPGGQVFLSAGIIRAPDGSELLKSGDTRHSMWRTVEWRLLRAIMDDLPHPLLDLGCGDGAFGALLTGRIEVGIDGDADAVGQCDPAVYQSAHAADLRRPLPVPDGSIASAFSNSTLEHVDPLAPAITSIARALRSGGRLIATVPTSGLTAAMTAAYGAGYARHLNAVLGHHNLWSWKQWEELLRGEGFTQIHFRGYLSRPAIAWYCKRSLTPWPQLSRRRPDWLWRHDLSELCRHVERSLQVTGEDETTCVLIDAIKG
ncbi:MAG: methyltransferase domain-containing protein [Candidatus Krumholzibacteriia bacterium]